MLARGGSVLHSAEKGASGPIRATQVVAEMDTQVSIPLPSNEYQARALAKAPVEQRAPIWQALTETDSCTVQESGKDGPAMAETISSAAEEKDPRGSL